MMSSERQRLRPWLVGMIDSGAVPGLGWINKEKTKFRVTWKHAGKPDFDLDKDAVLFRKWAEHTGKYKPGEQPDPSTWKTRFRCALHKMPDIEEVRVPHSLDDREPYRVFLLKPKVNSPRRGSSQTSNLTPSPSPPNDYTGSPPFSYPYEHSYQNGFINPPPPYGTYPYNQEMLPFSSPQSSTSSSSSIDSMDYNNNMFTYGDDLDNITPTLPPSVIPTGHYDDPMDEDTHEPLACTLSDVYLMKSDLNSHYSHSPCADAAFPLTNEFLYSNGQEPTFTELQSVRICGEGQSSTGYDVGLPDTETTPNFSPLVFGNNFQTGLLRMLQTGLSMEGPGATPISQVSPVYSDNTPINSPSSSPSTPVKVEMPSMSQTTSRNLVEFAELAKLMAEAKGQKDPIDISLSIRVFYDEKEVTSFHLDKDEHIWRLCYGKPVKPDQAYLGLYSQIYGPLNAKTLELPVAKCSKETDLVLVNFNRGLVLEMTDDGDIWIKRLCLSKVYFCSASKHPQKLSREVKTKVFDFKDEFQRKFRESQNGGCPPPSYDVTFTLGQPTGGLVCIVITHALAKKMWLENHRGEECVSEPNTNDKLANDLEKQYC